jgi:alanyl-tRNA synthetase
MGDTGPCGPCSEIFFDHGPDIPGGPPGSPDEDGDRFIEIWNLVFMQYEQTSDERVNLPRPSIDTGMGLERLAATMQGSHDNYDIDLLQSIMVHSANETNTDLSEAFVAHHKVIADHLRASSFLIADGVLPSNEGRGYVLRRIMRRAMRHAHMLGYKESLMWRLVPTLSGKMGAAFPELIRAEALITETLRLEEGRFKKTLDRGLKLLEEEVCELLPGQALPGEVAFKLYDTYGFPVDLTDDVLRGKDLTLDQAGFDAAMNRQKAEARKAWSGSGGAATESIWFEIREESGATEFLGYELEHAEGQILAIVFDGEKVDKASAGEEVRVVLNQTPFYGESGGQQGDNGTMTSPAGVVFEVSNTTKYLGDLLVHHGRVVAGELSVGDDMLLDIESLRRSQLRANHSATHLLHEAMRRRIGEHVTQKGSLVAADRLRFDVSHPKALSAEEISAIEDDVNTQIRGNAAVETRLMTPDEAVEAGALALFGEKYGDEVRVVSMGLPEETGVFSTELCGGTHVHRTGDIGAFKIISESAVAAGVRRIEALTGQAALNYLNQRDGLLQSVAAALKTTPVDIPDRIVSLMDERRRLERELLQARQALASGSDGPGQESTEISGVSFLGRCLVGVPAKDLRGMVDAAKQKLGSGVVAFVAVNDGKVALTVGVTDDLSNKYNAVELVRSGALAVGGKGGGGRPDMAQAGGPNGDDAAEAITAIEKSIGELAANA